MRKVLRVFPNKNSYTPDDSLAFIGMPPLVIPEHDEVHISCTFTWDKKYCEELKYQWEVRTQKPVKQGARKMKQDKLNVILENHLHWLNEDCVGWESMRADLGGADLRAANLWEANLRGGNLQEADLGGADLRAANLRAANLCGANLWGANLCGANLRAANLRAANLRGANLCGANLWAADLRAANLRAANLRGANLWEADLRGAINFPFIPLACPDTGSFIGYKKADNKIIKLEILKDAKRSSATTRKCRCDKARVLGIENLDGTETDLKSVASDKDPYFIYEVGKIVSVDDFDGDRWNECSTGIHFFINRQEAVEY